MGTVALDYQVTQIAFGVTSLDGLASDANLLAGRASAVKDNRTSKYTDCTAMARFKANASGLGMVVGKIELWVGGILEDGGSPVYPDGFDGTDKNVTLASTYTKHAEMKKVGNILTNTIAATTYLVRPFSVAAAFGGVMPKLWWFWVVHNCGSALNTTSGAGGNVYFSLIRYSN